MKRISVVFILIGFILCVAHPLFAHGGGTLQIVNAPVADAYQVSVWSAPVTVRAQDDIHITVGVGTLEDASPVLDATVQVDFYDLESGVLLVSEPATTEQSVNRLFYEADFAGLPQGDYEVVVAVGGADASGSVEFELTIRPYLNLPLMIGGSSCSRVVFDHGTAPFQAPSISNWAAAGPSTPEIDGRSANISF